MNAIAAKAVAALTLLGAILLFGSTAGPFSDSQTGLSALSALAAALFWTFACCGLGTIILKDARPTEQFAAGLGSYGLVFGIVCFVFGVSTLAMAGLGIAGIAIWINNRANPIAQAPPLVLLLIGLVIGIGLLDALSPSVDTDEIYQHLALPQQFLLEGQLLQGELNPDASRPLPVHLVYTALMSMGNLNAPKVFHLILSGFLLLSLWEISERRIGEHTGLPCILLLIGSYSFVREIGLAYNNLPVALWCLLALDSALDDRPKTMAIFSGMALAAKYTAAPVLVGIYLAWLIQRSKVDLMGLVRWTCLALLFVSPWWIRNLLDGLHPLFPYAGWNSESAQFMMLEKYGMGREGLDFFLLPWNLSVHADPETFVFLGRVTPAGLLLLPAALILGIRHQRAIALAASIAFAGWALGPHWLRYLLPAAPLLALLLISGYRCLPKIAQWVVLATILFGLPQNWGPWLEDLAKRVPASTTEAKTQAFLHDEIRGWEAVDWVNQHTPEDARVAMLFSWPKLYLERAAVLGSVEDHVPTRVFLERHGEQSLQKLKSSGVTHLVVAGACTGCKNFLAKSYPFLSSSEFEQQFREPENLLRSLLIDDAAKVFESAKYSVWRLL